MPSPHEHNRQVVHSSRIAPVLVDLADAVVQGVRAGSADTGFGRAQRRLYLVILRV